MDVEVDQKHGKGRLQSIAHATLLGDGMLERARATTLGLLGIAGAVGLTMIALVFNQGWPLVAGGPVPPLPPREQAVAKAKAVSPSAHSPGRADLASRPHASGGDSGEAGGAGPSPTAGNGSTQAPSGELVVVPAEPVDRQGDAPPDRVHTSPPPAEPKPKPTPTPPTQAAEQPPASPPAQAPAPAPPATVSAAPESSVPPWSNGKGHAYGRSEGSESAAASYDEDEGSHGHGYGHHDD